MRALKAVLKFFGSGLRAGFALLGIFAMTAAIANYNMTVPGSGTAFGSIVISSVHYAQQLICDATTPSQCGAVTATGGQIVDVATSNNQLHTDLTASLPIGSAIIGKVGIDQTTPGTTNGVQLPATQAGGVALGQALAAASVPVVMTAAQITTLTPPSNTGYATSANQGTDPCVTGAKTSIPISITTNTTTNILTGTSAKKIYVCQLLLTSAAADNVAVIQGTTGGTCGSSTLGLIGGVTAANGLNFAANGGISLGNGGAQVLQTTVNNNDICLITSAATPLAGSMTYVVQ